MSAEVLVSVRFATQRLGGLQFLARLDGNRVGDQIRKAIEEYIDRRKPQVDERVRREIFNCCIAHPGSPSRSDQEIAEIQERCDWCKNQISRWQVFGQHPENPALLRLLRP